MHITEFNYKIKKQRKKRYNKPKERTREEIKIKTETNEET